MFHGLFMRLGRIKRLIKTKSVNEVDIDVFNFTLDSIIKQLKKKDLKK